MMLALLFVVVSFHCLMCSFKDNKWSVYYVVQGSTPAGIFKFPLRKHETQFALTYLFSVHGDFNLNKMTDSLKLIVKNIRNRENSTWFIPEEFRLALMNWMREFGDTISNFRKKLSFWGSFDFEKSLMFCGLFLRLVCIFL